MIFDTYIPDLAFSSQLYEIVILTDENVLFELLHKKDDDLFAEIFREPLVPDNEGRIHIIDLQKTIDGYLMDKPVNDFKFRFTTDTEVIAYISRVILSRAELDADARKFVSQQFLTLMRGDKNIRPESLELLSVYALETEKSIITISATYRDNSTDEYEYKKFQDIIPVENQITGIDVSPHKFLLQGKTLVKYTVECGKRIMNYLVDNLAPPTPLEILFTNNFGVPETFATAGTLQSERKFDNQYGTIKGEYNKYDISFFKENTANTGIMDQHTADWIESDLFTSFHTFIVKEARIWKGITITDQTVKRSSDVTEQPAYEFKYRLSQRNQEVVEFGKHLYRLFDKTFDKTFD